MTNTAPRQISITAFIQIDAALLGVLKAYKKLENDKFSRGERAAQEGLERAAKRLHDAYKIVSEEENRYAE